jgi:hypothetical protein
MAGPSTIQYSSFVHYVAGPGIKKLQPALPPRKRIECVLCVSQSPATCLFNIGRGAQLIKKEP